MSATRVTWKEKTEEFKALHGAAFEEWFRLNNTFDVKMGSGQERVTTSMTFDEAFVL